MTVQELIDFLQTQDKNIELYWCQPDCGGYDYTIVKIKNISIIEEYGKFILTEIDSLHKNHT